MHPPSPAADSTMYISSYEKTGLRIPEGRLTGVAGLESCACSESMSELPAFRKPRAQIGTDWTANATRLHAPKLGNRRALQQRQIE